jgi:hypothetical protein
MSVTITRIGRFLSSLAMLSFMAATCSAAQESPEGISPAARIYLHQVLDLMQRNALNTSSIDWPRVREETLARAKHAKTTADTYPAIAFALTQLKEHHSFLQLPDSLPPAQRESIAAEISKVRGSPQSKIKTHLPLRHKRRSKAILTAAMEKLSLM